MDASPVRDMPSGIRNQVYELALLGEKGLDITDCKRIRLDYKSEGFRFEIALAQTWQQICSETYGMLFAGNDCRKRSNRRVSGGLCVATEARRLKGSMAFGCSVLDMFGATDVMVTMAPVSYTHLTLPTKRIV